MTDGGNALLGPAVTFQPDPALPARGRVLVHRPGSDAAGVAREAQALGFSAPEPAQARLAAPASGDEGRAGALVVSAAPVAAVPLDRALPALLAVGGSARQWRRLPDSLWTWVIATTAALTLVRSHHLLPDLRKVAGEAHGAWRASAGGHADVDQLLDRVAEVMPVAAHALAFDDERLWAPRSLLDAYLDAVADWCARRGTPQPRASRPRERLLPWTARWTEALTDAHDSTVPLREHADDLVASVASWHAAGHDRAGLVTELHLDAPDGWRLRFAVRTADGQRRWAGEVWEGRQAGDLDAVELQEGLLAGLGRASRVFPPLDAALRGDALQELALSAGDAWELLSSAAPLLESGDLTVVVPDGLVPETLRLRLRFADLKGGEVDLPGDDEELLAGLDPDVAVSATWELAIGDEPVPAHELEGLVAQGQPLTRWRGRWVHVDADILDRFNRLQDRRLPLLDGLLLGLGGSADARVLPGEPDLPGAVEVVTDGPVAQLMERLHRASGAPVEVGVTPPGFTGELRAYQQRGVAWLRAMSGLGLGAVLADDMGLGKTVQLIAHLVLRDGEGPHLVVCPTSVVGNWERELARFAPGLPVTRFHGPERPDDLAGVSGVVVTSYGVVRRDVGPLAAVDWDVVALDEAQHVKNPSTAGARNVRDLRARQVVALTGTPMENRLAELWTLLDATNRGLLGSRARFGRRFVTPIERVGDAEAAARLRRIVAPFVLRRRKDDPAVLTDLPEKIERTVVCSLTPEQAELYEAALDEVMTDGVVEADSAMERRGRVLALLTALKQVCNHPAQYLGEDGGGRLVGRSGKFAAAREIVASAVGGGDQVLVFTQYVRMGRLLARQLAHDLGADVPFLHGGVPATSRDDMVAAFQGEVAGAVPPVLVVSLRAGGTGLNLTAATHVVHYDRWWNPAVEDQATDRAHRIGQERSVEVHKLVTAGTVEERIADLLERKRELADVIVGEGEAWLTELGDDDLADLVALSEPGEELDDDDVDLGPPVFGDDWDPYEEAS